MGHEMSCGERRYDQPHCKACNDTGCARCLCNVHGCPIEECGGRDCELEEGKREERSAFARACAAEDWAYEQTRAE